MSGAGTIILTNDDGIDAPGLVALQSKLGVEAIRAADGATAWSYAEGADTVSSSALADGVLYVPSNGVTALELDPADLANQLEEKIKPALAKIETEMIKKLQTELKNTETRIRQAQAIPLQ